MSFLNTNFLPSHKTIGHLIIHFSKMLTLSLQIGLAQFATGEQAVLPWQMANSLALLPLSQVKYLGM